MGSYNRKNSTPLDIKLKQSTTTELLSKTPSLKHPTHSIITPTAHINSSSTHLCKGTSVSTGRPCKRLVVSDDFCFQHKDQITGKNIFGIPTTSKKNSLYKNEVYSENEVIDLTEDLTKPSLRNDRREKLVEIENQMSSLSLNNSKKDQMAQGGSKIKNDETGSTVITINLNKLKVQITEELSKKSTQVSISSEGNRPNFDGRDQTPPPVRSDVDGTECPQKKMLSSSTKWVQTDNKLPPQDRLPMESPACVDDSFLETTNKELFQTPTLVTPSSELVLAPLLSVSPSQSKSPLDSLFEMINSGSKKSEQEPKSPCQSPNKIMVTPDRKPPSTPTPTRTRMLSSYVKTSYETHISLMDNQNTTPGSITPTRSRNQIDLTGDYYSPSTYNSPSNPSNLCQKRIKNGKICNRRIKPSEGFCHLHKKDFIEHVEELEKAVFVPGRARLTYLRFGEWIKPDLLSETKYLLRSEMEKPISESDEPGFIYAYRLLKGPNSEKNPKNSRYTLYKIGRATNVHRRLYQWAKQCGYIPELIEMFPNVDTLSSLSSQEGDSVGSSNSDNQNMAKCKYTHRAERLIHIELGARFKAEIEKCKNCGNSHREWFKVMAQNLDSPNRTNVMHGWDEVRRTIIHWVSYIEKVYGVG